MFFILTGDGTLFISIAGAATTGVGMLSVSIVDSDDGILFVSIVASGDGMLSVSTGDGTLFASIVGASGSGDSILLILIVGAVTTGDGTLFPSVVGGSDSGDGMPSFISIVEDSGSVTTGDGGDLRWTASGGSEKSSENFSPPTFSNRLSGQKHCDSPLSL